ncbi:nuclear transport factor 2 family protein [Nordella sp. HKS 07]|uniref:YybH family protein n=1 Tax=Nordella sp. HKS 07 TaxID=2712222 RepID=UPI0013E1F118|nr:nuclear transport factor 2 family protein [Nordella sp. HKS 07]QIG49005.1 nuclear transport factor 2 family protein [Nordella sp. HKS 07]
MNAEELAIIAEVRELHRRRGEDWLRREPELYLSYYWNDAVIFAVGERTTLPDLRKWWLAVLEVGGGPLSIDLPPADDIVISALGDAATTSFEWRQRFRAADGAEWDRSYCETNVWYRRNDIWKIVRMHITTLGGLQLKE